MRVVVSSIAAALLFALVGLSGCASIGAERRAPMIGEHVAVDGVRMHALLIGPDEAQEPPVVLIHGASVNMRDMKIALGDRLSADRQVLIIDRPGRGYSERPSEGWRLEDQARLIKGVVDHYGISDPIIIGQSLGGAVALRYALDYQDEMTGLVTLAAVSHEWPGGVVWYNRVASAPGIGFVFRRAVVPVYSALVARRSVESSFKGGPMPENYYDEAGIPLLFRPKDFKANALDVVHLKRQIQAQQDRYGELAIPVMVATGLDDVTVSPQIHSKTLAGQAPKAELTLFEGTGHALHHTRTNEIIALVEAVSRRSAQ